MAYNSDGYIMIDFTDVDFRRTNQTIEGLYKRCVDVIGTNKFILVINANGRTPLPATCSFTNNQYVIDTVIYMFAVSSNDNLFIRRNDVPASDIIDDSSISVDKTWSSLNTVEKLAPIDTIVNNPAVFNTSLALPLVECSTNIMATQEGSGDPSPDNVRPIHGFSEVNVTRAGKNLIDSDTYYGEYKSGDVYIAKGTTYNTIRIPVSSFVGREITISAYLAPASGMTGVRIQCSVNGVWNNGNNISGGSEGYSSVTVTPSTSDDFAKITFGSGGGNNIEVSKVQIELNSNRTAYEPYVTPTIYPIQLGQEVYGAEVDVVNGVAHVTHKYIDMGSLSWNFSSSASGYFYANISDILPNSTLDSMCEEYNPTVVGNLPSLPNYSYVIDSSLYRIYCKNYDYTDATDFTNAVDGVTLVYKLRSPFTVQLTPTQIQTLIGNNTIFADTGNIKVSYRHLPIDLL